MNFNFNPPATPVQFSATTTPPTPPTLPNAPEFTLVNPSSIAPRLIVGVFGAEKTGKTDRFAFGMPAPIGYLNFDKASAELLRRQAARNRPVYVHTPDVKSIPGYVPGKDKPASFSADQPYWIRKYDEIRSAWLRLMDAAAQGQIRSVAVDNCGLWWHICQLAKVGAASDPKAYSPANTDFKYLLGIPDSIPGLNVSYLSRESEVWGMRSVVPGAKPTLGATGEYKAEGFKGLPFATQANVRLSRVPPMDLLSGGRDLGFRMTLLNTELSGDGGITFENENCGFVPLARYLLPTIPKEVWD